MHLYLGSYGCISKIQSIPGEGQYHGCPFKYSKKLNNQLTHWGVKSEEKTKRIAQIAKNGQYQLACACFFEATHDIEDIGNDF